MTTILYYYYAKPAARKPNYIIILNCVQIIDNIIYMYHVCYISCTYIQLFKCDRKTLC